MQAQISHRHDRWNEETDDYAEKRLERLERLVRARDITLAPLHLSVAEEGHGHTECSARVALPGVVLSAHGSAHNIFTALRIVFDELEQQLDRRYERAAHLPKKAAHRTPSRPAPAQPDGEDAAEPG